MKQKKSNQERSRNYGSGASRAWPPLAVAPGCRVSVPPKAVFVRDSLSTAVRSQFGFKMESVWNQRFTSGAISLIEPAKRLQFSDF